MAISRIKTSSVLQGFPKSRSLLAGNAAFFPLAPGSYESIATVTVGSGGSSTITFNSIPSDYTHLQVRGIARTNSTTQDFFLVKPNNANLSARHGLSGYGSGVAAQGSTSVFDFGVIVKSDATANTFSVMVLDILDYKDTNKKKTIRTLTAYEANTDGQINLMSGLYNSTSAITSLVITTYSGTSYGQYSHFALYGIKGS
jgi:hypothetical protein